MSNKIDLYDDYEDNIESSDDEFTEREKTLLKKVTKSQKHNLNQKVEVFAFDENESASENFDVIENSDLEEDNFDDIPDSKAWGSKRAAYYNTDFVDQDYSTYNEKEEEQALQEEEEAKAIQQRLAKELDEADFSLDVFSPEFVNNNQESGNNDVLTKTILRADLSDLTKRQKLQIFEKDSPEFGRLMNDFHMNITQCDEFLQPLINYGKLKNLKLPPFKFLETINEISLNYLTNIIFYLFLKAKRISIKNHPVVKRLVQMKKLLMQLDKKFENSIKPQLFELKEQLKSDGDIQIYCKGNMNNRSDSDMYKKIKYEKDLNDLNLLECNNEENVNDQLERRGINYQISKNKGLTPHRKRELRNPRVKHRNKFRKALIRRKGAIRLVRTENKRYSGEISGIKANVKKGIKIKS